MANRRVEQWIPFTIETLINVWVYEISLFVSSLQYGANQRARDIEYSNKSIGFGSKLLASHLEKFHLWSQNFLLCISSFQL